MYKNQLQELAQRSCFNLPSYTCIREGPDHAPRFKAVVNFNGDLFESPNFCTTLRQAEHSAAEVALHSLSSRAPSHSLAARILDETGVYKNLLQEISQRVGARLPSYTTSRSGLGHLPVFTCTVELAGITFTGEPAKNKKQAEKNAAMAAWSSLKKLAKQESSSSTEITESNDEQEQITISRALLRYRLKEKMAMGDSPDASPFPKKFPLQPDKRPSSSSSLQSSITTGSKILPLIRPLSAKRSRPPPPPPSPTPTNDGERPSPSAPPAENRAAPPTWPHKFHVSGAAPYVPLRHYRTPSSSYHHGIAPPVAIRTTVPVFSAPPLPANRNQFQPVVSTPVRIAPPVQIRQAVPVFAAKPGRTPPPVTVQVKQPDSVVPVKETVVVGTLSTEPVSAAGVTSPTSTEPPPPPVLRTASQDPLSAPVTSVETSTPVPPTDASADGLDFDLQHSLVIETLKELEL